MWRVKYSRASPLRSGSGEVIATYSGFSSAHLIMKVSTYQMEDCAGQDTIDGEIDASLHAEKSGHSK